MQWRGRCGSNLPRDGPHENIATHKCRAGREVILSRELDSPVVLALSSVRLPYGHGLPPCPEVSRTDLLPVFAGLVPVQTQIAFVLGIW
eukprot:3991081-Amphidinium_carterae.1